MNTTKSNTRIIVPSKITNFLPRGDVLGLVLPVYVGSGLIAPAAMGDSEASVLGPVCSNIACLNQRCTQIKCSKNLIHIHSNKHCIHSKQIPNICSDDKLLHLKTSATTLF